MQIKTLDLVVIAICAALYATFGILTAGLSFFGIGFLPAVVIPAVFAYLFGPWVGGIGGAIGIFIRDMYVHHIPLLSLAAGVPPNFILFFLIGYIAHRQISLKQALAGVTITAVGLTVPTIIFLPDFLAYTKLSRELFIIAFSSTVILSLVAIAVVAIRWKEWRSYAISAVVGETMGAGLLSLTVFSISPFFKYYFGVPIPSYLVFPIFVWLFATELPFILLLGPPIIKACQKAFPRLVYKQKSIKDENVT